MPLSSLDIVFYYTDGATGPSNNTLSLGGTISTSTIPDNTANNIYDDVTGDESSSGDTEYRGIAIKDTNATYTMINPKVWITGYSRAGSGADTISIAKSTFALNSNTMGTCTNEGSAPSEALSWVVEGTPSSTITWTGTLNAGNWFGLWFKREVPAGASAYNNRSCTIQVQSETTASPYTVTVNREFIVNWYGPNAFSVIQ
jgi:hypothetical protein